MAGILLAPLILCSCRSVDVKWIMEKGTGFPATDPDKVKVEYDPPQGNYIAIADLKANGNSEHVMRKAAAKLGADAVVVKKIGVETSSARHCIFGTAIKYK